MVANYALCRLQAAAALPGRTLLQATAAAVRPANLCAVALVSTRASELPGFPTLQLQLIYLQHYAACGVLYMAAHCGLVFSSAVSCSASSSAGLDV